MRLIAALIALLATPAFAATDADAPVMPETPSGMGDPQALTCRAPQPLPSGGMGPRICMHNEIWARLTITGKDLSADGKSVFERPTTAEPSGNGNPDAVTCRRPSALTASRTRRGPEVCLTNGHWKQLAAEHKRVNSAGVIVSTRPTGPATGPDGIPVVTAEISPPL
jgi:hypothetical protein